VDLLATVQYGSAEGGEEQDDDDDDIITRSLPKSLGDFCFDGRGGSGRAVSRIGLSPRPEVRGCGGGGAGARGAQKKLSERK